MGRLCLSSTAALIGILAIPAFNSPTAALTSAKAIDSANAHPNVGVIMIWRDANNPLGLPGGLAAYVTGVLIHPQTILTAGHFTAELRVRLPLDSCRPGFGSSPALRQMRSISPPGSSSIPHSARASLILRFRGHVPRRAARSTTSTARRAWNQRCGLCFLDEPVLGIRPAKLAKRSLDDESIPGRKMRIVGYGTTAPPPRGPADTSNYDGLRRWGTSTVDQVVDQNWVTFNRDPVTVCFGDSGAPTFFKGRVVAIASDGAADCASADVRARVDSKEVRMWIKSQIRLRFPF